MRKALAVIIGGIASIIPGAAGLAVLVDPLRRKAKSSSFIRITTLDALPDTGEAKRFQVFADKQDAWTKLPQTPIGAVFLQRKGESVVAFSPICPHAGCFVDVESGGGFHCPCHNSKFAADGSVVAPSPSQRGLDTLDVDAEALKSGVVQVRYQKFIAGIHEKKSQS